MTSTINVSVDSSYPVAFVNNSSTGFRNNFGNIKQNLERARDEISLLHDKDITFSGDVSGLSSKIQEGPAGLTANLTLIPSGVTAGTYDTVNAAISLSVDSKGRVVSIQRTPKTPDITLADMVDFNVVTTPTYGMVESMDIPEIHFDQYGNLIALNAHSQTVNFGIVDYPLGKGSIIVGNGNDRSDILALPTSPYDANDYWVIAWRKNESNPISDNFELRWTKLPPIPTLPDQIGEVDKVFAGNGIAIQGTDYSPVVAYDVTKFSEMDTATVLTSDLQVLTYDNSNGNEQRISIARIQELNDKQVVTNTIAGTYTLPESGVHDLTLTGDTALSLPVGVDTSLKENTIRISTAGYSLSFSTSIKWNTSFVSPAIEGFYELKRISGVWYGSVFYSN